MTPIFKTHLWEEKKIWFLKHFILKCKFLVLFGHFFNILIPYHKMVSLYYCISYSNTIEVNCNSILNSKE